MEENGIQNELIEGRNAVIEALRAGRAIDKIYIARGDVDKTLGHIASKAKEKGIVVADCDRRKLDFMSRTHAHQGVIAVAAVREYCSVEDILKVAQERGEAIDDKASAGAAEHMAIARVPNIPAVIKELKNKGLWIYGTAADGSSPLWETDFSGALALVIGSEGDGMGRLVADSCDFTVSLPMKGQVSSLNAAAAASITMYEVLRQRSGK